MRRWVFAAVPVSTKAQFGPLWPAVEIVELERRVVPGIVEEGVGHDAQVKLVERLDPDRREFVYFRTEDWGSPDWSIPVVVPRPKLYRVTIDEIEWPDGTEKRGP